MSDFEIKQTDVPEELVKALKEGRTYFTFIKKDGTERSAVGTLNLDLVPDADKQFKHTEDEVKNIEGQTTYYDLDKFAWRSCKFMSVRSINGKEVVL